MNPFYSFHHANNGWVNLEQRYYTITVVGVVSP